jgi:hypothetical protein
MTTERITDSWADYLKLKLTSKTGLSTSLLVWAGVAVLGILGTTFFLGLSVFIWLADRFSPLIGALILTGFFLLVLIIAVLAIVMGRRSTIERAEFALAKRKTAAVFDASLLNTGLQIGRALGWRRFVPLVGVVLLAAGLARDWHEHGRPDQGEGGG